jgi:hypothetical protein
VLVGLGVFVEVGNTIVGTICGWSVGVLVGGRCVKVEVGVGEDVSVAVGVNEGVEVGISTRSANACAVNAAPGLRLESAKSGISCGSITMGVGKVGSERAIAEVAQKKLKPRMLAKKIHNSPA